MKAQRLPSGRYRCQITDKKTGKRVSFTAETAQKAQEEALKYKMGQSLPAERMPFKEAYSAFVKSRESIYSPNTLREYKNAAKVLAQFDQMPLGDITDMMIQQWVNSLASRLKPKTVANYYGYLSAIMSAYMPQRKLVVRLPRKDKTRTHIPSESDIMGILCHLKKKDRELYIVTQLGAFCGMRRGEVAALDIDHIYPEINKAHVEYSIARCDGVWIRKKPKTFASDRYVPLPPSLVSLILEQGYITKLTPQQISKHFKCALKTAGIPHFRFHDLRHFSVSKQHSLGIPDVEIMAFHGFSTDYTMKNVYRQVMDESKVKNEDRWLQYTTHELEKLHTNLPESAKDKGDHDCSNPVAPI